MNRSRSKVMLRNRNGKKKRGRVYLHPLFFLLVAGALFFDFIQPLIWVYLITMLHEFAHMAAAHMYGISVTLLKFMPFGIEMRLKDEDQIPARKMAVIAAAGPFCNLVLLLLTHAFCSVLPTAFCEVFITTNAMLLLVNLLPTIPLDGGKILRALLLRKYNEIGAARRTLQISKITTLCMLFAGIFIFLTMQCQFSLLLVAVFICFYMIDESRQQALLQKKILFHYKEKLRACGSDSLKLYEIAVPSNVPLRRIIQKFELEQFNVVSVLNQDMRVVCRLSEGEIIDAVLDLGACATVEQIL